ncbi:MAG: NB-ARC domain-containing protein [Cyanobacteria bacterium J06634_5]
MAITAIQGMGGIDVTAVLPPAGSRFQVLMTTRDQHLATTVTPFKITELSETAVLDLLRQILNDNRTDTELETAKAVCQWLGYLPLGLELVGQYIKQKPDVSYEKLQTRLTAQRTEARSLQNKYDGMTAKLGVVEAFELSWQTLSADEQQLACWLSMFALAPIFPGHWPRPRQIVK